MDTIDHQITTWDAAAMLDALPERVNRYRVSDLAILYCNAAWAAQYRVDPAHAIGRSLIEFLSGDEQVGLHTQLALLGPDSPVMVDTVARAVPNAPGQWLEWVDRYVDGPDGPEVLSIGRDVTRRHIAEQRLADSEARFRELADRSSDVVWRVVVDPIPRFEYLSPSVEHLLGYPPDYFLDDFDRLLDLVDDEGRALIDRALRGESHLQRFDLSFRHADGTIVTGETRASLVRGGVQGVSRDVTELRRLQAQLAEQALRDPLTGLLNRRAFDDALAAELARSHADGSPRAIVYVDLDGLKPVNDMHGHEAGDLVLRESADRLMSVVGSTGVVARLGGDEFVAVYRPTASGGHDLVDRLDHALAVPIHVGTEAPVSCPASIGTADTRTAGHDPAALLAAADGAMYAIKRTRSNVR